MMWDTLHLGAAWWACPSETSGPHVGTALWSRRCRSTGRSASAPWTCKCTRWGWSADQSSAHRRRFPSAASHVMEPCDCWWAKEPSLQSPPRYKPGAGGLTLSRSYCCRSRLGPHRAIWTKQKTSGLSLCSTSAKRLLEWYCLFPPSVILCRSASTPPHLLLVRALIYLLLLHWPHWTAAASLAPPPPIRHLDCFIKWLRPAQLTPSDTHTHSQSLLEAYFNMHTQYRLKPSTHRHHMSTHFKVAFSVCLDA